MILSHFVHMHSIVMDLPAVVKGFLQAFFRNIYICYGVQPSGAGKPSDKDHRGKDIVHGIIAAILAVFV